jgi:hypothetical protein
LGDRNFKNKRNGQPPQRRGGDLAQRPFKQLRGFKVGPSCLKCNETIDLRRQSTGNGYLHSACEPKKGQQPVLFVEKAGDEDLILVKVAATEELAEAVVPA